MNKKITPKEILKIRKEFRSTALVRNIYSEVLNIIQPIVIYKLKKKKDKKNRKYLEDALLTSIAGISAAMKNTGWYLKKSLFSFYYLLWSPTHQKVILNKLKKKAIINKPEIIFPIPNNLNRCQTKLYVPPDFNRVEPILDVQAPTGYGLDNRFDYALNRFSNFSFPCGGGNPEACELVKEVILNWAKSDAAKRTSPSNHEDRHWNDTLTVNLWVASPMMAAYSFAKQIIKVPDEEDKIIKDNKIKKVILLNIIQYFSWQQKYLR